MLGALLDAAGAVAILMWVAAWYAMSKPEINTLLCQVFRHIAIFLQDFGVWLELLVRDRAGGIAGYQAP